MKTRLTELFGIKHPIMMAGMGYITTPPFTASVSNAGALGNIAISMLSPEEARKVIREIRALTDKPFAVNVVAISPTFKATVRVLVEEKVPVVNYTLGRPAEVTPLCEAVHGYGGKVVATVTQVKHAMRAAQLGVDVVNLTGHEGAGHAHRATSLVLVPMVAAKVKIPILSAGGYHNGRGLAAALVMGADGITMGTRFCVTKESPLHEHWKKVILESTEQDTIFIDMGAGAVATERLLKTKTSEAKHRKPRGWSAMPATGLQALAGLPEIKRWLGVSWGELIRAGLSTRKGEDGVSLLEQLNFAAEGARAKRVMIGGDEDAGFMSAGQCVGGIEDIPSVTELIDRIVTEAQSALEATRQRVLV